MSTALIPKDIRREATKVGFSNLNLSDFSYNDDGYWISTNHNHSTIGSMEVTCLDDFTIDFEYYQSSEGGYDYGRIYKNNVEIVNFKGSGTSEQIKSGTFTHSFNAGDVIKITYTKDSSGSKGEDCFRTKIKIDGLYVDTSLSIRTVIYAKNISVNNKLISAALSFPKFNLKMVNPAGFVISPDTYAGLVGKTVKLDAQRVPGLVYDLKNFTVNGNDIEGDTFRPNEGISFVSAITEESRTHVYFNDETQRSANGTWSITYDEPVSLPYLTFKLDGYMPAVSDIYFNRNNETVARFRSHSNIAWGFAKHYAAVTNYQIITEGSGTITRDGVTYHNTGMSKTEWHTVKLVIDRIENAGWLYIDDTNYGKFTCGIDWAEIDGVRLLNETATSSYKNLSVTGYNSLEEAMGD